MVYLVSVMCGMQSTLCAGFSLCYVRDLVCVMCSNAPCQHRATRVRYSIVLDIPCQPCQGLPAVSC